MLNDRQHLIVDLLVKTSSPIGADDISKIVIRSKRTIMRDLSTIKLFLESQQIGELLVNVERQGYRIKIDNLSKYEEFMKKNIRDEEIILLALINQEYVTMEYLADLLYVSKITVSEKMNVIKENYQNILNIEITHKGHRLQEPLHKKCILLSNLVDNNTKYYLDKANIDISAYELLTSQIEHNEVIKEYFPNVLPTQIANIFVAAVLLHNNGQEDNNDDFSYLYTVSGIAFSKKTLYVLTQTSDACVNINLNLTCKQILQVLHIMEEENSIRFHEEEMSVQLYQHLKRILCYPYYLRAKEIHNIMNIKALYPFSFDLSILFLNLMEKLYGYQIPNRDLIGLYFAVGMEKLKTKKHQLYIYSNVNSIANINKQLLEASLSNCTIDIVDHLTKDQIEEASLIINSTGGNDLQIENQYTTEFILSELDISNIKNKVESISINKNIRTFFPRDYSFTYDVGQEEGWSDVIRGICNRLTTSLAILPEEATRILERENSGNPLVIGAYSIPHCISKRDDFCISIYVHLTKEIQVEGSCIRHVLVTLMNPTMKQNINIFKYLYRYLNNHELELKDIQTYEEFIQFI